MSLEIFEDLSSSRVCNAIFANCSVVGGGYCNIVCGNFSAILGGSCNVIPSGCNYVGIFGCNVTAVANCAFHANTYVATNMWNRVTMGAPTPGTGMLYYCYVTPGTPCQVFIA